MDMAQSVVIYDATDDDLKDMGPGRAEKIGAKAIPVKGGTDLENAFSDLVKAGTTVNYMVIYTHGTSGTAFFGNFSLTALSLQDFNGKGFERVFAPGAFVVFDGCNVAEIRRDCDLGSHCYWFANGYYFLEMFARIFLSGNGGYVSGWNSYGFGFPIFSNNIVRAWGDQVIGQTNRGATRVRVGVGKILDGPTDGTWKVSLSFPRGSKEYEYHFRDSGKVVRTPDDDVNGEGTWKIEDALLKLDWGEGQLERWDLPLFNLRQTGVHVDGPGDKLGVYANELVAQFDSNGPRFAYPMPL
jgi:hypothetical protein